MDICGHLLHVAVHAANRHDTKTGGAVLQAARGTHPSLVAFSADAGYRGTAVTFVRDVMQCTLHISKKLQDTFAVLPKRWIVERTFAWMGNFRRLAKDFEVLTQAAENMIRIAMIKVSLATCF